MSEMRITGGKGVHFTFKNGWTISIQIGGGNYCDNYDFPIGQERERDLPASSQAEIAYWPASREMQTFDGGDTVKGYVPIEEVLDWINKVRALPAQVAP